MEKMETISESVGEQGGAVPWQFVSAAEAEKELVCFPVLSCSLLSCGA